MLLNLKYRGFKAKAEFDYKCGIYCGRVLMTNSPDVVTFKGKNIIEIMYAFEDSVDDYLEFIKEY